MFSGTISTRSWKYDYDVTAVPGPLEAIRAIQEKSFTLMITDLRMPDMDGRALVEKVHAELDPDMMVIVITAFEDDWPMDQPCHPMCSGISARAPFSRASSSRTWTRRWR